MDAVRHSCGDTPMGCQAVAPGSSTTTARSRRGRCTGTTRACGGIGSGAARVWERHNVGTPRARHTEGWAARTGHGAARTPNLTPSAPVETHGRGGGTMTLPNDGAWTRRGRTASEGATAPATLRFRYGPGGLGGSREGGILPGGGLVVDYDPTRLLIGRPAGPGRPAAGWDILVHVRFHPGGQSCSGSVVDSVGTPPRAGQLRPAPLRLAVPSDAERVELWFEYRDGAGGSGWDSRYGQHYWFDLDAGGLPVPERSVVLRTGAIVDPGLVRVARDAASKERAAAGTPGRRASSRLAVEAWVRDAEAARRAWIDLHLFDAADEPIHSATVPLERRAGTDEDAALFAWDAVVYQGSGGGSGMGVELRPDAHMAQYRLYAEVHGQVFTDGVLHQLAVPPDRAVL